MAVFFLYLAYGAIPYLAFYALTHIGLGVAVTNFVLQHNISLKLFFNW